MELSTARNPTVDDEEYTRSSREHTQSKRVAGRKAIWSLRLFVIFAGLSGLFSNGLRQYINSQISTIEKQLRLSSLKSGSIKGAFSAGYLIFVIIGSHFGMGFNRPRVVGFSVTVLGLSGIMAALPHFILTPKNLDQPQNKSEPSDTEFPSKFLCLNSSTELPIIKNSPPEEPITCESTEDHLEYHEEKLAFTILVVAFVVQGISYAPRSSLVLSYVDDHASKRVVGYYFGIINSLIILGALLSFVLGGLFSRLYVQLKEPEFGLTDPRWIGAWWLGFLVFGGSVFISGLPFLCLPAETYSKGNQLSKRKTGFKNLCQHFKALLRGLRRLVCNPVFCALVVCKTVESFVVSGKLLFMMKYVEIQFDLPVWKSVLLVGPVSGVVAHISSGISGVIVSKLRLDTPGLIKMMVLCSTLSAVAYTGLAGITCETKQTDLTSLSDYRADSSCSKSCGCGNTPFPVCGSDGVEYISPCFAGCTAASNKSFQSCACVGSAGDGSAFRGYCQSPDCSVTVAFLVVLAIGTYFQATNFVPFKLLLMRVVEKRDKSLAYGTMSFFKVALGDLPSGPLVGLVIDTACLVFPQKCGRTGACALYEKRHLRLSYLGLLAGGKWLYAVTTAVVYLFHRGKWK